jgi:hypothetical protein
MVKGETTPVSAFGNPLGTDAYTLCVYGEAGASPIVLARATAPAGGTCKTRPCWKATGDRGFKYKDAERTPDGIDTLVLKAGTFLGRARIKVKAQGESLSLPVLPLDLPVRVQLQAGNDRCWEATYSPAGVGVNDAMQFKGAGD